MRSKFKWIFTLVLALSMQFSFAQEKTVTGTVTDGKLPLPGANVVIKGTAKGVSADMDGKYSIKAKSGDVLLVSYSGYDNKTITVGSANSYNVALKEITTKLDDVVITGALGIKKKKDAQTSSQQVIGNKELTQANNPSVISSLTAKVSGLQINNTSSGVNGSSSIVLRGPRSVSGNTEALIVIDNAISTSTVLAQLSPDIVESVNIIKGAQGSALYGEQGSNGVVVVTTKKGSGGNKLNISVNSSVDFENISFLPQKQSVYGQGWDGDHYSVENGAWGPALDGSIQDTGVVPQQLPFSFIKDNMKKYYQTGTTTQNGVSLNFGGEEGYALFSANRLQKEFVVNGDQSKRNSFTFKGGKKIGKWKLDGGVTYISSQSKQADADNTLEHLLQSAPNIPVENFANAGPAGWTIFYNNPFWERQNDRLDRTTNFFNTNLSLGYEISKHINVSYLANLQTQTSIQETHKNSFNVSGTSDEGDFSMSQISEYYRTNAFYRNFYSDLMVNLDYTLAKNVSFKANIGNNIQDKFSTNISQGGKNLQIPEWYNIQNVLSPDLPRDLNNNSFRTRKVSYFANFDFGYNDYLFLNLTGREDMTSTLITGNNSYFYPSAGLSFVPTKAFDGLKSNKAVNYLKVFANFARVGNSSAVNPYDIERLSPLGYGYPFQNNSSYGLFGGYTNVNIKPEFTNSMEAGLSLRFLKDRLSLDATVYKSDVTNLVSNGGVPYSWLGYSTFKDNIGNLTNKGLELDLGFTAIKTQNFTWDGRISYSTYESKVTSLNNGSTEIQLYDYRNDSGVNAGTYAIVGESFPSIKGTVYQRDNQGNVIINSSNGMPLVSSTRSLIGKVNPDYIIGFSNNFTYKGLRLAVVADYRTGNSFISGTKYNMTWSGNLPESADFDRTKGFIFPNSVLTTPTPGVYIPNTGTSAIYSAAYAGASGSTVNYYGAQSQLGESQLIDGTQFKIREIALSYSLPKNVVEKLKLSSLRFGINARNPFIFFVDKNNLFKHSNNRGYADSEASNVYNAASTTSALRTSSADNTNPNAMGYAQTGQYPSTKTFGFSVNLTF